LISASTATASVGPEAFLPSFRNSLEMLFDFGRDLADALFLLAVDNELSDDFHVTWSNRILDHRRY
jgi:hypothetical protein